MCLLKYWEFIPVDDVIVSLWLLGMPIAKSIVNCDVDVVIFWCTGNFLTLMDIMLYSVAKKSCI